MNGNQQNFTLVTLPKPLPVMYNDTLTPQVAIFAKERWTLLAHSPLLHVRSTEIKTLVEVATKQTLLITIICIRALFNNTRLY